LRFAGITIQTNKVVEWQILPAPENYGINFVPTDTGKPIRAVSSNVLSTDGLVVLGRDKNIVCGVEHILSALHGCGITNASVICPTSYPPEVTPLLTRLLLDHKTIQRHRIEYLSFETSQFIADNCYRIYSVRQAECLRVRCSFTYASPYTPKPMVYSLIVTPDSYRDRLSTARTFCDTSRLWELQKEGNAQGVMKQNCLVIPEKRITTWKLNDPEELVKHKILDFVGDLFLAGRPVLGDFNLFNPNHATTHAFLSSIGEDCERSKEAEEIRMSERG
jgi:UDP-3-O-acyl-N-acetylglucosamine deacetylase